MVRRRAWRKCESAGPRIDAWRLRLVEQGSDAQQQDVGVDGLGHEVVRAALQAVNLGLVGLLHGHHQDGDAARVDVHADAAAQFVAADARQVIIEQDQVGGWRSISSIAFWAVAAQTTSQPSFSRTSPA